MTGILLELARKRTGIELKFLELCEKVVSDNGLSLYDLDYIHGSQTLRLFVMNPETSSAVIEDCVLIDRALTPFIEEEEWMPQKLTLEVSSPGIYRPLNCKAHFEAAIGKTINVSLTKKIQDDTLPKKINNQRQLVGLLKSVGAQDLILEVLEHELKLNFTDIKKANLEADL